jgi:predicted nucleotidyltransferase
VTGAQSNLDVLQSKAGVRWEEIDRARRRSADKVSQLTQSLRDLQSAEASIVVYGSLARAEWTAGSDLDWTLLVDGGVDPQHSISVQRINDAIVKAGFNEPGRTGTFASLSISHDLVHRIGGQDDTNQNTTRRVLLLVESLPIGRADAYDRVKLHILHRYVEEDWGIRYGSAALVPRFLLNDIVRYWRTMAVDFAQKQRERGGKGWGLRNAKLRMSRKLLFTSGLVICLLCQLDPDLASLRSSRRDIESSAILVAYLKRRFGMTPLDVLAQAVSEFSTDPSTPRLLFGAYDGFLAMLDDEERRKHLETLKPESFDDDLVFKDVRRLASDFQRGLIQLFFKDNPALAELTMKYGVF